MRSITITLLILALFTYNLLAKELSEKEILDNIDARIEKHRKGDAEIKLLTTDGKPLPAEAEVTIEQTRHQFLFGSNIFKLDRCRTPEDNAAYEKQFAEMLNFATLPFYWWNYTARKDQPADDRSDMIVTWCREHNITTKGHPLAWNYVDPRWLPDDPAEAMELQLARITRCVKRFKGSIDIWDVVNEATHYDRPELRKRAPILTKAIDNMGIGEYVRQAFRTARAANPGATLLINDYRTDPDYEKKVIAELVDDNGKSLYDVIGIQSHMHGGYWGATKAWQVCETYAKYGVPLHFTETTVVSGPRSDQGWKTTPEGEKTQAKHVVEFYSVLFSHPAVEAITWWDFTDQNAWQGAPAGFLRDDMTPKPAYTQLKNLIKGKWWTQTTAQTDAKGAAKFRGFYGDYKVTVTFDNKKLTGAFHIDKTTAPTITVKLK